MFIEDNMTQPLFSFLRLLDLNDTVSAKICFFLLRLTL